VKEPGNSIRRRSKVRPHCNRRSKVRAHCRGEIDEAALFRNWIPYYIAVQIGPLEVKFRATVRLLDDHQQGLGQRLRNIAEKTIDIEPETSPSAGEADSI